MKKAMERSTIDDRAYSLVHPSMKKAMKRSVRQGALAYDEVSAFLDYLDSFPSIPVSQISQSSSTDRANDSKLAADSETAMTDDWTNACCDLRYSTSTAEEPREMDQFLQELGGETEDEDWASSFLGLDDWTFGFDATTTEQRSSVYPASDSTHQELDADSMMTQTSMMTDDEANEHFDFFDGATEEQQLEKDQFVGIEAEVLAAAILLKPGEFSEWIEAEMDSTPAALMTGVQSPAIADSFQHLGIR